MQLVYLLYSHYCYLLYINAIIRVFHNQKSLSKLKFTSKMRYCFEKKLENIQSLGFALEFCGHFSSVASKLLGLCQKSLPEKYFPIDFFSTKARAISLLLLRSEARKIFECGANLSICLSKTGRIIPKTQSLMQKTKCW